MRLSSTIYNLSMSRILIESMSLMLAAGLGLFVYNKMNRFQRLILFLLLTWVVSYVLSYVVTTYQVGRGLTLNNVPVHNITVFISVSILSLAGYDLIQSLRLKKIIQVLYAIFICIYIWCIYDGGFWAFATHAFFAECFIVLAIYAFVLYQKLHEQNGRWYSSPEVWISLGLILYYSCVVPLMSVREYLIKENIQLSIFLFYLINDGFANVMYLFIAVGFYLIHKQAEDQNFLKNA